MNDTMSAFGTKRTCRSRLVLPLLLATSVATVALVRVDRLTSSPLSAFGTKRTSAVHFRRISYQATQSTDPKIA